MNLHVTLRLINPKDDINKAMNHQYLSTPWAGRGALYSAPGELIVKLKAGEVPSSIPAALDVRRGAVRMASQLGVGSVDRVINALSDELQVSRVHASAACAHIPGEAHEKYTDIEHVFGLSRTMKVQVSASCCINTLVDALRQLSTVEDAYPHYLSTLPFSKKADPLESTLKSLALIRAKEAQHYEKGDPTVIIAVIDTGVNKLHPELKHKLRPGVDTVQLGENSVAAGLELVGDLSEIDTDPEDYVGHGTACAALIGARGYDIAPGIAGQCQIMPIRVLGAAKVPGKDKLVGVGALADINEGVKRAIDLGAKVINMSFGTPESQLDESDPVPHADVIRYGLARGCVMIAASGNSGKEERYAPASLPGVIAVGASTAEGVPASFTTSGGHVSLSAPGQHMLSAGLDGYQSVTGTSFAAPFVSAVAALLVSRGIRRSVPVDGAMVNRILQATARPWPISTPQGYGAGILDAYAALEYLDREINQANGAGSYQTRNTMVRSSAMTTALH